MNYRIRPAKTGDEEALYALAQLTGGGFTNLPADLEALRAKIDRSNLAFSDAEEIVSDHVYVLVLEHTESGQIVGTAQIFAKVGTKQPFYSYRLSKLTKVSPELNQRITTQMLSLTTDLEGCSEVGGLFLHPDHRTGGLGLLLARCRYLFIRLHRARFADRFLAELRGVIDEKGQAPFWNGLGNKFFGMSFQEADQLNSLKGNHFISDLMPDYPIYTALLPESAQAVIGQPHMSGRPAMRMLQKEGFQAGDYIDIFDGGPTMIAATDQIRSIANAREAVLEGSSIEKEGQLSIIATGHLKNFRASYGTIRKNIENNKQVKINQEAIDNLQLTSGDKFIHIPR
ncbi:arginine N-succinyltransferase [Zymomonas mobilis]|uniref:Arginine/ornithine succinyltransferase subunit n=1 Tax=Zymomonas mobilis subsp. pomaceae (strain ATCC 29192 / DSM 22645 / JCM 10191 / CCUG 17912 / NBRC 13757 / NCIMB 11200 / NRRL B-4491 / Barker I) TaxID=579138 RepID=F8ERL7_ZYMMT|nr:arginine N-succinyltransferase [Zymomonas mobilis]AEI37475.1 arginine/ornithine succinyltransferase subunit [Zymomonas mobilis subsp. pomaceae ATCC 29192]MDX5948843.1 arginine N-succinyltransferase [Zymomonas mobilis subsp. pomaceae]GEB88650.1 arginine N-succinyltransferase [Zymomonas mobilis subsp. pomaceae]